MPAVAAKPKSVLLPRPNRHGTITYDQFCNLVSSKQKADLIDGVIYMASPDSLGADQLSGWLYWIISGYLVRRELGKVFGSRVALRLDDKNGPEPDISVVLNVNSYRLQDAHILGPCDVAVEVVSPDSVERDYVKKRALYEKVAVPEYWIVDEDVGRFTLLRLGPKGYAEVRPRKGVLTSKVVPGFWLRPDWLWQSPRPNQFDILDEILAGVPS